MADHPGEGAGSRIRGLRAPVQAAAALLLVMTLMAACTPDPSAQEPTAGAGPGAPDVTESSPSDGGGSPESPSDDPEGDEGRGAPSGTGDDKAAGGEGSGGETSGDEDDGESDPDPSATDGWQAPDDPTAEGPTAAPAQPEVHGTAGEGVALPTEMTVSLVSISTTTLTAETPGEYAGPAVVVEIQVQNESDTAQTLDSATASLEAEGGEMGVPTWASPNDPLQGEVAAGSSAAGVYVFMLDPADSRSVTVRVNYSAGAPVAVFTGVTP